MDDSELETIEKSFDLIQRDLTSEMDPAETSLPYQYAFYHRQALVAIELCTDYQQFIRARTVIALGLTALEHPSFVQKAIPQAFFDPSTSHDEFFQDSLRDLSPNAQYILNIFLKYENIIRIKFTPPPNQEPSRLPLADIDYDRLFRIFLPLKIELDAIDTLYEKHVYINTQLYILIQKDGHMENINYEKIAFVLSLIYIDYGDEGLEEYLPYLPSPDTFIQKVRPHLSSRSELFLRDYEINTHAQALSRDRIPSSV